MAKTQTILIQGASAIAIGLALFATSPAAAAPSVVGEDSSCVVVNPNRFQCNFPASSTTLEIQYASMQCGSTGTVKFSLQEFQVLTTPPGSTSEVAYQIPITNQASLEGVVSAGSPVTIYAAEKTTQRALIDLVPAPNEKTQCTVSISGTN